MLATNSIERLLKEYKEEMNEAATAQMEAERMAKSYAREVEKYANCINALQALED